MIRKWRKLLLVENHRIYRESLRDLLLYEEFYVETAAGPEEALAKTAGSPFDLCIISRRLPNQADPNDKSGIHLIEELASRDKALRFILHTAYIEDDEVQSLMRLNSDNEFRILGIIKKQERPGVLLDEINELLLSRSSEVSAIYSENIPVILVQDLQAINSQLIQDIKKNPKALYEIQPNAFEELVAELLASYGWKVDVTKQTRDGGYDIFAVRKDISGVESSWIVECKRYRRDRKVGIDVARALYGIK